MEKQIFTDEEGRKFLMKAFNCSRMQVWKALHFQGNSNMQVRIRTLALKRGGVLIGGTIPECETTYQEVEKSMTQTWGERVKIVYNQKNGEAKVYVDGDIKRVVYTESIPEYMKLQMEVEQMALTL